MRDFIKGETLFLTPGLAAAVDAGGVSFVEQLPGVYARLQYEGFYGAAAAVEGNAGGKRKRGAAAQTHTEEEEPLVRRLKARGLALPRPWEAKKRAVTSAAAAAEAMAAE